MTKIATVEEFLQRLQEGGTFWRISGALKGGQGMREIEGPCTIIRISHDDRVSPYITFEYHPNRVSANVIRETTTVSLAIMMASDQIFI